METYVHRTRRNTCCVLNGKLVCRLNHGLIVIYLFLTVNGCFRYLNRFFNRFTGKITTFRLYIVRIVYNTVRICDKSYCKDTRHESGSLTVNPYLLMLKLCFYWIVKLALTLH